MYKKKSNQEGIFIISQYDMLNNIKYYFFNNSEIQLFAD
jgi:hypothetical protein